MATRQRGCLVASRSDRNRAVGGSRTRQVRRPRLRFRRRTLDDCGSHRRGGPRAGTDHSAIRALQLARRSRFSEQTAFGDALRIRRAPGKARRRQNGVGMSELRSDALVFFGATGDLAYKKIFPGLQAMLKRGHLDIPVIGVAKAGWTLEQLRTRAHDSLPKNGASIPRRLTYPVINRAHRVLWPVTGSEKAGMWLGSR